MTWQFLDQGQAAVERRQRHLQHTTPWRIATLLGILAAIIVFALLGGCASTPQEWCDENPRACRVVVVGTGVLVAGCVAAVAVHATQSNTVRVVPNARP
jgi:hypothetical protein